MSASAVVLPKPAGACSTVSRRSNSPSSRSSNGARRTYPAGGSGARTFASSSQDGTLVDAETPGLGDPASPKDLEGERARSPRYIDTYTIEQAVEDKATVPIFYESRALDQPLKEHGAAGHRPREPPARGGEDLRPGRRLLGCVGEAAGCAGDLLDDGCPGGAGAERGRFAAAAGPPRRGDEVLSAGRGHERPERLRAGAGARGRAGRLRPRVPALQPVDGHAAAGPARADVQRRPPLAGQDTGQLFSQEFDEKVEALATDIVDLAKVRTDR